MAARLGLPAALFSLARYSPLPGWWMPDQPGEPFPTAGHVRDYLAAYETRYDLPVWRNVDVDAVHAHADHLEVRSRGRIWRAHAVISAIGTWRRPRSWPPSSSGPTAATKTMYPA